MLNHITLMGRLTADPSYRRSPSGIPVATFSIACQRDYADKSTGEKAVDFIDCVAWRHTADFVSKYMTKGRMAVVDGRLQLRDWTDRNGVKRRSAEIVANSVNFGDSRPQAQAAPALAYPGSNAGTPDNSVNADTGRPPRQAVPAPAYSAVAAQGGAWTEIDDDDSELPF